MAMLKINLLPPRIKAARQKRMMMLAGVAIGASLLTIPAGLWYVRFMQVRSLQAQAKQLDRDSAEFSGVIEKVSALEQQESLLAKKLEVLDKLTSRQSAWIHILEAVSTAQASARDLWLQSTVSHQLEAAPDTGKTELVITGSAFSVASFEAFVQAFQKTELKPEVYRQTLSHAVSPAGQSVVVFAVSFKFKV